MIRNIRNNGGIMLSVEGERKGKDGRAGASVSFLKDFDPAEASAHLTRDAALLTRLHDYDIDRAMSSPGRSVRHPDMLPYVEEPHTRETIAVLRKRLKTVGTFGVFMNKDHSVLVDGKPQKITIVKATPAEANGDMDGMVWVRDQNEVVKTKLKKLRFGTERNQREE